MKTKKPQNKLVELEHEIEAVLTTPLHLRIEYFFRARVILLAVMALTAVAVVKSDGNFLSVVRDAYHHGYSTAGVYLRKETVHAAHSLFVPRVAVAASK